MDFTHIDRKGNAVMVDVSGKETTLRTAQAAARVLTGIDVYKKIEGHHIAKGDVLSTARIAGIQAAKKTSELIPLCHNIFISRIDLQFTLNEKDHAIEIQSTATTTGQTGIEMEALTAVTVAALTIYDMCKAISKSITITDIRLISKTGGKSGAYHA